MHPLELISCPSDPKYCPLLLALSLPENKESSEWGFTGYVRPGKYLR
jgi:hypothetical protein